MRRTTHTYHFGRLHLLGASDDNRKHILKALQAEVYASEGRFKYGFFEIQEMRHERDLFVFGQLVKYRPLLESELVDEREKRLLVGGLPLPVVSKSNFFLHYDSSVVAYRPVRNSDAQFRRLFAELVKAGSRGFVDALMDTVDEEYDIVNSIGQLDRIDRLTIDIQPSNPSMRHIWGKLDERLKDLGAKRLRQTVEATSEGFSKQALESDEAYQGIVMAADGYGKGTVEGRMHGQRILIHTGDSPVIAAVINAEYPETILEQLMITFRRIWDRVRE